MISFSKLFHPIWKGWLLPFTIWLLFGTTLLFGGFNDRTEAMARLLGPSRLSAKTDPKDLENLRNRMVPILMLLEKGSRTNGPSPESLLENAYDLRKDIGPFERMLTSSALLKNWRDAHAMGLFDEESGFQDRIAAGRGAGERCVFEHIVLPEALPAASTHLANIRIVDPGRKSEANRPPNQQELSYQSQLEKIIAEISSRAHLAKITNPPKPKPKSTVNSLGQSKAQEETLWKAEVTAAGESFYSKPNLRVAARVSATPSHLSQGCWEISATITNLTNHPTEVEIFHHILGTTDKKRQHYRMAEGTRKLLLRAGQSSTFVLRTKAEGNYKGKADDLDGLSKAERQRSSVHCRGFVLRAIHTKEIVGSAVTDRGLQEYVEDSGALARIPAL